MGEITIHETAGASGTLVRTRLVHDEGRLALVRDGADPELAPLPDGALDAVMKRYGKPLDLAGQELRPEETLDLGDGKKLVRFRFMPRYDVIARDYLALVDADPASETLCELATAVAAALDHLARRYASASP